MKDLLELTLKIGFILGLVFLMGCHTIQGIGKDLQKVTSPYTDKEK